MLNKNNGLGLAMAPCILLHAYAGMLYYVLATRSSMLGMLGLFMNNPLTAAGPCDRKQQPCNLILFSKRILDQLPEFRQFA